MKRFSQFLIVFAVLTTHCDKDDVNLNDNIDVSGNHGEEDFWIVKLDGFGTIQWQKSLGGSEDDHARSIQQTTDGGYIVAGDSESNDGDILGN